MCFLYLFSNETTKVVKNLDICKLSCDFIEKDRFIYPILSYPTKCLVSSASGRAAGNRYIRAAQPPAPALRCVCVG